ncbi:hypothetical protein DV736_g2090, partial [Chaetothyriales sp. CBS 134916]
MAIESKTGNQNSESSRLIDGILGRKSKPKENGSVVTETQRSKPDSGLEQAQSQKTETIATTTTTTSAPPPSQPPSESTTAAKPATKAPAATTTTTPAVIERSISPGTLPDGRHVKTDGDKGLSYVPPNKLGKLGAKLGAIAFARMSCATSTDDSCFVMWITPALLGTYDRLPSGRRLNPPIDAVVCTPAKFVSYVDVSSATEGAHLLRASSSVLIGESSAKVVCTLGPVMPLLAMSTSTAVVPSFLIADTAASRGSFDVTSA